MSKIIIITLSALVLLNIIVSIMIIRRYDLDKFQKIAQSTLVWLIPFIGAIGFWLFHRSHDNPSKPSKSSGSSDVDNYTVGG